MTRPHILVTCSECGLTKSSAKLPTERRIAMNGCWRCKACATALRNIQNAKPVGSIRLHRKSGYLEEKTEDGWRRQHIVIFERHIGRRLAPGEIVHHSNEMKCDNRIENLRLMTNAEHTILHNKGTRHSGETIRRIRDGIARALGHKLNPLFAQEIRRLKGELKLTNLQLANRYEVSMTAIHRVINRKAWN